MSCNVCGAEKAEFVERKRQRLCSSCAAETPSKITRAAFDLRYWGKRYEDVPQATRREFYDDYLTSAHAFDAYVAATTSTCC